jgi:trehalose utilization protein
MIRVTVWNEFRHEKSDGKPKEVYPDGIHNAIKCFLQSDEIQVRTATLDDEECGLTHEVLKNTDVLIWWGHMAHSEVPDEIALRVRDEVEKGMGAIFLHSAHHSKPFKLLMGTSGNLSWRENGDLERIWICKPSHPIVEGIDRFFEIPHEEMYGEPFSIPEPDELIMIGWYEGGEVFRSGCTFRRGGGKIFYFQPGHETFPVYYQKEIQTIIKNAVRWAHPIHRVPELVCPHVKKLGE